MALTKKDLQEFGKELTQQLKKELISKESLVLALEQQHTDIVRDIRDEMDARFLASENKMEKLFRHELQAVIDVLLTFVPERFEKLEHDVVRVKAHIGLA